MQKTKFSYIKILFAGIFAFWAFAVYAADGNSERASLYAKPLFHSQSPMEGNPKGDVTIVDFFDYQCGHCGDLSQTLNTLIKSDSNVRIVFKDLPILGEESEFAAKAALAAAKQNKYLPLHNRLMALGTSFTEDQVLNSAKQAGLNMAKFKQDMNSKAIAHEIKNNLALSQKLQISGTPTLVIAKTTADLKGQKIYIESGAVSEEEIKNILRKIRSSE